MATNLAIEPLAPPATEVVEEIEKPEIRRRVWGLDARTDTTVSFAEFTYWAKIERAEEREAERKHRELEGPWTFKKMIMNRFSKGIHHQNKKREEQARRAQEHREQGLPTVDVSNEKQAVDNADVGSASTVSVTDEEWKTAARALRTATWGSIFFLVTTDILGWSSCPFVFASVGYGAGVALYVVFGLAAAASGLMLWSVYISLDSSRFPMLSYGDLFLRVFGPKTRHFINITQSFQQFCSVMVLILGNGQVISQLAGPNFCFIACMIIVMAVGMIAGSVRTLQRLGWLCNFSVWLNIATFIIIMAASSKYGIDYKTVWGATILPKKVEPVMTFAGEVPNQYQMQAYGFAGVFNGVDSMVYAYSGAILFVAFMAEMRHPMDFWKGMICAQAFICFVYILFGAYVYSNFGQYSYTNIFQVIQPYSLQTTSNVLSLLTGFIACVLYFNIGMKTVYIEVFQEVLHFPPIATKRGRWMWYSLGPCYWILAFLIAAAVPNLTGVVNFIGGLLSLNFTYSFPGVVYLGWSIHEGAVLPDEGFDPVTGVSTYHDSGMERWIRGFFTRWMVNVPCLLYVLASLACSGMGTWAAVEGLKVVFGPGGTVASSYGCPSPVWGYAS